MIKFIPAFLRFEINSNRKLTVQNARNFSETILLSQQQILSITVTPKEAISFLDTTSAFPYDIIPPNLRTPRLISAKKSTSSLAGISNISPSKGCCKLQPLLELRIININMQTNSPSLVMRDAGKEGFLTIYIFVSVNGMRSLFDVYGIFLISNRKRCTK